MGRLIVPMIVRLLVMYASASDSTITNNCSSTITNTITSTITSRSTINIGTTSFVTSICARMSNNNITTTTNRTTTMIIHITSTSTSTSTRTIDSTHTQTRTLRVHTAAVSSTILIARCMTIAHARLRMPWSVLVLQLFRERARVLAL